MTGNENSHQRKDSDCPCRVGEPSGGTSTGHEVGELRHNHRRQDADRSPTDVYNETFPSSWQMCGEHSGHVVPPKTIESVEKKMGAEDPDLEESQMPGCREKESPPEHCQGRADEHAQHTPLSHDIAHNHGEREPSCQRSQLLNHI